jgi:hypothetical protein
LEGERPPLQRPQREENRLAWCDYFGRMAVVYPGGPTRGFRGDTSERCGRCGRSPYTVLRVVYEGEAERLAP